jgi:hypothetical protein
MVGGKVVLQACTNVYNNAKMTLHGPLQGGLKIPRKQQ